MSPPWSAGPPAGIARQGETRPNNSLSEPRRRIEARQEVANRPGSPLRPRSRPPSAPPGEIGRMGLLQIPVRLEGQVQKNVGVTGISLVWRRRNGSAAGSGVPDGKNGPSPEPPVSLPASFAPVRDLRHLTSRCVIHPIHGQYVGRPGVNEHVPRNHTARRLVRPQCLRNASSQIFAVPHRVGRWRSGGHPRFMSSCICSNTKASGRSVEAS